MKKDKLNYYDEFIKMTEIIGKTTTLFRDLVDNYSVDQLKEKNDEIHRLEHESDNIVHNVKNYLISDFLPPIDREDIGLLIHKLDNVEDELDEIAKNFYILNIRDIEEQSLKEYLELLGEASNKTKDIFKNLSNNKNRKYLLDLIMELNEIENSADRVYENYIKTLYESEKDPITVIKWTTIYNGFESLFDNYEKVADCIESIIIKSL